MIGSEKDIVRKDSNTEKTTINIFGDSVSREIFPQDTEFEIRQYVSFSSPMSLYQPKGDHIIKAEDLESLTWGSDFAKRCLLLDNNKQWLEYLTEKKSDWLLLDFADIRLKLVKYGNNTTSLTNIILKNKEAFEKIFGEYTVEDLLPVEKYKKCINWFCNKILNHYKPKRIILHKYYLVDHYIAKDGTKKTFKNTEYYHQINSILKELYALAEERLKGCYVIEMPEYVLGDENHIWGTHPLHYVKEYYTYAYEALQHIINTKKAVPDGLYMKHTNILMKKYLDAEHLSVIKENKKLKSENSRLLCYTKTFEQLTRNMDITLDNIKEFCNKNNIRKVAFWGDFIISEVLADLLKKAGISLEYIVCNWNHHTAKKVIPVSTEVYPEVDAIIVCNIFPRENSITILKNKVDFPIYNVNDFIPLVL